MSQEDGTIGNLCCQTDAAIRKCFAKKIEYPEFDNYINVFCFKAEAPFLGKFDAKNKKSKI